MIRKLKKNTIRLFAVLTVIVIGVIVTFGVFIYKYMSYDKTKYDIAVGSVLYDEDLNYILTSGEAYITQKMDKKYYMYEKKDGETYKYSLGKNAVVYKENDTNLYLYGVGYQVLSSGDVNVVEGETRIVKSSPTKLFKLDDRKYLIVDSTISAQDSEVLKTTGYVIVDLDKQGNPSFANNLLSFKTIAQVVLNGSNLNFDVANETMIFNDKKIDLKNIIGSTNEFDPSKITKLSGNTDPDLIDGTETANGIENGNGNGDGGYGDDDEDDEDEEMLVNNYYDEYLNAVIKSINNLTASVGGVNENTNVSLQRTAAKYYDFSRWVALKSVSADVTSIHIGYSVFDPSNEYQSVWLEIEYEDEDGRKVTDDRILDKDGSTYSILDRKPGTNYNISLMYQLVGSSMQSVKDSVSIRTRDIKYDIRVNKISKVTSLVKLSPTADTYEGFETRYRIDYQINMDENYKFNNGTAVIECKDQEGGVIYSSSIELTVQDFNSNGIYYGTFELPANVSIGVENSIILRNMRFCNVNSDTNNGTDCGSSNISDLVFSYKFYEE